MPFLQFFDVETQANISTLNIGTVAPSSSDDTPLRLLNTSDQFQAEDVTVAATGTDAVQLWLSLDGDSFAASINIGDIPPSGTSDTFWLRRVTPSTSATGGRSAALSATPAAWTAPVDTSSTDNIPLDTN
jgi:hypothetical protein